MNVIRRAGIPSNNLLRIYTAILLLAAQVFMVSGGCNQTNNIGNGNNSETTNDNGTTENGTGDDGRDTTDNANTGDDGDLPGPGGNGDSSQTGLSGLEGNWVVKRVGANGDTVWGWAVAEVFDPSSASLTVMKQEGSVDVAALELSAQADGSLAGSWTSSSSEPGDGPNWTGTMDSAGDTVLGHLADETGTYETTFYRGTKADFTTTGMWSKEADNGDTVVAYDDGTILISILTAGGDWEGTGQFDGTYVPQDQAEIDPAVDVFRFTGDNGGGEGIVFDGGDRILLLGTAIDQQVGLHTEATLLRRSENAAATLTGRWIGGDRRSESDFTHRGVRVVVDSGDALYVHNRDDASAMERFQILRGDHENLSDQTPGYEWSGHLSTDGDRITGEWVGYDGWYNSMEHTRAPEAGELTGQWYSIDINWVFSDVDTVFGTTTITHNGDTLIAEDVVDGVGTYRLEARWVGDHFEGSWWDTASPDETSPWRGELSADGSYIHGRYDQGEWSFSVAPFLTSADEAADAQIVFAPDPYTDTALVVRDDDSASMLTTFRSQDRVTSFTLSMPEGPVEVVVDERYRPTIIDGLNERVEIVWADDSASADVTITREVTGETTQAVIPVDLSDETLLNMVADTEEATGRDLQDLTTWIEDNPGYIAAVARGEIGPEQSVTAKTAGDKLTDTNGKTVIQKAETALNGAAVMATLFGATGLAITKAAGTTAGALIFGSAATATAVGNVLILAAGVAGAIGLAIVAVVLVANLLSLIFGGCCEPCGLACFINCCPVD